MTRILLCHQPVDGGVGRHVGDLAQGLCERGYEVVVCGPSVPAGLTDGATHVHLDLRREVELRSDLAAVADFTRIIHRERPHLVHAHSSKAGAVARLARFSHPRTPVLYTPHGYSFAGYFSRSSERLVYRNLERLLAPLASRVVCVCEAEARLARSIGPNSKVRVVHNGIQPAQEGPVDGRIAALSRLGPVIGAVTLLRPGKGLETLIDALPRVLAHHRHAQVAILGEGSELAALRARAQLRGVADNIHFLGPSADPLGAVRGMDVFVHPSWAEAFPYVILEAMSLGTPTVASDVGGVAEALVHRESGLLVPPREDAALAQALLEVLDDRSAAARMGANALGCVSRRFTQTAMIDRLAGVYDELMRSSPRPVPAEGHLAQAASPSPPQAMTGRSGR